METPKVFVNKPHQMAYMWDGGGRAMNALLPREVRQRGASTTGKRAHESGRLKRASERGAARGKEIAAEVRAKRRRKPS